MRYTLLRILVFFVALFGLWAIPFFRGQPVLLLLAAATVSMVASLVFLNGPREEMSERIARRVAERHGLQAHSDEEIEDREAGAGADPDGYR